MSEEKQPSLAERLAAGRGKAVRQARESMGLSQAELAEKAETSQQTVDRIERGVVGHSRAYPAIARALGIPNEGFDIDRIKRDLEHVTKASEESYKAFMREGKAVSELNKGGRIPIYAPGSGSRLALMNAIPRGYPVEFTEGAYGLVMFGTEMEPAIRNGEIAIVNPNLPPMWDSEVVVQIDGIARIRTFMGETDEIWRVKQWKPEREFDLPKSDHEAPQLVVAKISRSV